MNDLTNRTALVTGSTSGIGRAAALAHAARGRGVRVNAVAPGPTPTPRITDVGEDMANKIAALAPAGPHAEPEELASAIVFLASDDASFVHGVTLAVDAGRMAT